MDFSPKFPLTVVGFLVKLGQEGNIGKSNIKDLAEGDG